MRPIAIDRAAWSICLSVCVSVFLLVAFMSPAKTAEPIEMPFGWVTQVGPRNQVLDGGQICLALGSLKSIMSQCCGVCSQKNE